MKIKEIKGKSLLNKSKLDGYTLNPYLGCNHGCVYCYNQHFIKRMRPLEKWGSFLEIKINAPEILEKEVKRLRKLPNFNQKEVFLSTITDPYNSLENKYKITRKCLEILFKYGFKVQILTKSRLILRDFDLFKGNKNVEIGFTITTLSDKYARILEPKASLPSERLKILAYFSGNLINTYAFIGPILPYFTNLEEIVKNLSNKANFLYFDTLNTKKENWLGLEKALNTHFPQILAKYKEIFFKNRENYENRLKNKIFQLSKKYRIEAKICF